MHLLSLALPMILLGVAIGQSDDPSYLGCFSDPAGNRVFEISDSTSAMTAEACSELCPDSAFYGTQYSTECWCGDNVGYADNGDGVCDMACSGNSDEICGGSYALSVYSNDPNYLGCWSDPHTADTRLFSIQIDSSEDMTTAVCEGLCADYPLYGTQYSTECWCDDGTADYEQNGPAVCDFDCVGSSDGEFCGGYDAMSIRQHEVENPYYLGCFYDPPDNHIGEPAASSSDMTAEVCSELCSAYQYYGTQHSTECWCGYDFTGYSNAVVAVCDMPCSGDSNEICGGFNSKSVYETENIILNTYRGCYSDPADNRVFVQDDSSDAMTAELCASQCSDSAFFGTQYSTECWCGDINAPYSVNGEGVCDMPCLGNSDETCGGPYNMDVYAHDPAYLGCFSDPADGRIFEWESSTSSMTAEVCASLCSGSAYYGTQYSQECWCGDNADYGANGFGVCDMPCSGNSDEMCGGAYTMSVYQAL